MSRHHLQRRWGTYVYQNTIISDGSHVKQNKLTLTGPGTKVLPAVNVLLRQSNQPWHVVSGLKLHIPSAYALENGFRVSHVFKHVSRHTYSNKVQHNEPIGTISLKHVVRIVQWGLIHTTMNCIVTKPQGLHCGYCQGCGTWLITVSSLPKCSLSLWVISDQTSKQKQWKQVTSLEKVRTGDRIAIVAPKWEW